MADFEGLNEKLDAGNRELKSKTLRVNVKTKMMISGEKAKKVKIQGSFFVHVAEKMSNSIFSVSFSTIR